MEEFINSFLAVPEVHSVYLGVKIFVIILDIFFLVMMLYSLNKLLPYRPRLVWDPRDWQKHVKTKKKKVVVQSPVVAAAWKKVETRLKDASPESLRLAVIEADGIVDEAMKRMGLAGETFADRLGHVNAEHAPGVDAVWEAHRLRNNLVHTPDFHLAPAKAEAAIKAYEAFLKESKAL